MEIDMQEHTGRYRKINDEIKNNIIMLSEKHLTGGEIASKLGITRNSVIGFLYRLKQKKLAIGETPKEKIREKKPKIKVKVKQIRKPKVVIKEVVLTLPDEPESTYTNVGEERCTIDGLRFSSCRFIVEEGNHETTKYCGKTISQQSYCKEHYQLCYYPSRYSLKKLLDIAAK